MTAETTALVPALDRDEALLLARTLDELAAAVAAHADLVRAEVDRQMRAEFDTHRSVATWRAAMGSIVGQLTQTRVDLADEAAFTEHVRAGRPTEVVEKTVREVRPAYRKVYLESLTVVDGQAVDPDTGEIVPGVRVQLGGAYKGVQLRPNEVAKRSAAEAARRLLGQLALPALPGGES